MENPSNDVYDTPLCIVKRHKGRGRYELYVHHEPLRNFIKANCFQVVGESLKETKALKKKMLFKELNYGKILALILDEINSIRTKDPTNTSAIQAQLEKFTAAAKQKLDLFSPEEFESESDYINSCYLEVLRDLRRP